MSLYNFPSMKVGEAFTFPVSAERNRENKPVDVIRVRQAASQYKRRSAPDGWQYSVRMLDANTAEFRRVS